MLPLRKTIKESVWILLTTVVLAAGAYMLRPDLISPDAGGGSEAGTAFPAGQFQAVDLETAVDHFNSGSAIFADARPAMAYQAGHIEGALHLDPYQFDAWADQVFSQIDPDTLIITYCDGERCTLAPALAEKLTWLGYNQVVYLKNGWSSWAAAQLPVDKGDP